MDSSRTVGGAVVAVATDGAGPVEAQNVVAATGPFQKPVIPAVVPDEAGAHAAYSRLLYRAGRLPDAALAARRASDLNPGDVESLNFLASILMQMNQTEQAAQVLEKSLAARPDQPGVAETLKRLRAGR